MKHTKQLNRREFLRAGSMTAAGLALWGCAKNPVTGQQQFMLVSEDEEIAIDKQQSPHQISADYGPSQDQAINDYITEVGTSLAQKTHRPEMPYSFRMLNATYVNAYAFPGGTIACTRGIILELDNEAELAALLGHELGHVNARHSSANSSKQFAGTLALSIGSALIGMEYGDEWGALAGGLGGFGAGALLMAYSRDNEREADSLGMEYMTRAEYTPDGMIELSQMLVDMHDEQPSAFDMLFATHPMSSERLANSQRDASAKYQNARQYKKNKESFMDHTASLRKIKDPINTLQKAEELIRKKNYFEAEKQCDAALAKIPDDYGALLIASKCQLAKGNYNKAEVHAAHAIEVYPQEPQAMHLNGVLHLKGGRFSQAFEKFTDYEAVLPGNPMSIFYKGYCQEGMGNQHMAAEEYYEFLQQVNQGEQARHAYYRLVAWGYITGKAEPVANPFKGLLA